tara:strand:- start:1028 stop:2362 length:1335 start_codon:yes stop_codon:yes gene_type:complete
MKNKLKNRSAVAVPAGRLARLAHISSMTARVASSVALGGVAQLVKGQRPVAKDLLLTPLNIGRVTEQLAKMRGAAMKIGQLISMDSGDYLPPELAEIMASLRDGAHSMPPKQLKKILNSELPHGWLASFNKFDVRPIAAASIGQVHRAQLRDGRDLAIKIQYPGVATSIDSDVANVRALIKMSGLLPAEFPLDAYLEEGRAQLHEETNYTREATNLIQFKGLLKDSPQFVVPMAHVDWSTPSILTMDYVSGIAIEDLDQDSQDIRDQVVTNLISLAVSELFVFLLMQTDPNFANYRYQRNTQKIVLLDFGAVLAINPSLSEKYKRLILAGFNNDISGLADAASDIGFFNENTSNDHRARITQMIRLVFDLVLKNDITDFKSMDLPQQLQADGLELLKDGFIPPILPIDVLLVQRKFAGIFLLATRLGASINIGKILRVQGELLQ